MLSGAPRAFMTTEMTQSCTKRSCHCSQPVRPVAVQRLVPFCHVRETLASRARVVAGGSASEAAKRFTGALRGQTSQR